MVREELTVDPVQPEAGASPCRWPSRPSERSSASSSQPTPSRGRRPCYS